MLATDARLVRPESATGWLHGRRSQLFTHGVVLLVRVTSVQVLLAGGLCMYECMNVCMCICMCMYIIIYIYIYIYTYVNMYIYIYIYIYLFIYSITPINMYYT